MISVDDFYKIFSTLCEYYNYTVTKDKVLIYYSSLQEYSEDDLKKAFRDIIKNNKSQFMPKVFDILEKLQNTNVMYEDFKKDDKTIKVDKVKENIKNLRKKLDL